MSNVIKEYNVDLCIIGAGAGGLSIASGAAQLGRSVVLYEAEEMGGDCLNYGCVPSKALIAAGKHAHAFKTGAAFGVAPANPKIDFEAVKAHVQGVIEIIAPVDSQERFEGMGVTVIRERAKFKDESSVQSATTITRAKRIVIATGSRASAPPIPGLRDIPYITNETVFSIDTLPKQLIIIGSGPIGLELGQAFLRLGTQVDIVDIAKPLSRSEPEHAQVLIDALKSEGVTFHAPVNTKLVRKTKTGVAIDCEDGTTLTGCHLLVAAGRRPVIDDLNLEAAGITAGRGGIVTDKTLRTSNKRVYAVGDASGRGGLTHIAGHHASIIIKNFYFVPFFKASAETNAMPASIYTQPELASIGLTEKSARAKHGDVRTVHFDFDENDRGIAERSTKGGVKIIARGNGRILGGSVVGEHAGEIIHLLSMAMANNMKIIDLTKMISPYPTRSEAIKRAASSWYTETVFSPKTRKLAALMARFH